MTHISPKPCDNCPCDDTLIPVSCKAFITKSSCSVWWGFYSGSDNYANPITRLLEPFEVKVEEINDDGEVLRLVSREKTGQILILAGETAGKYRLSYKCSEEDSYIIQEVKESTGPCPLSVGLVKTNIGTYCEPILSDVNIWGTPIAGSIRDHNGCVIGTEYNITDCNNRDYQNIRIVGWASAVTTYTPDGSKCGLSSVKIDGQEVLDLSNYNFGNSDGPGCFNVCDTCVCENFQGCYTYTQCKGIIKPLPLRQDFFTVEAETTCGAKAVYKTPVPCELKAEYISISLPTVPDVNLSYSFNKVTNNGGNSCGCRGTVDTTIEQTMTFDIPGTFVHTTAPRWGLKYRKVGSGSFSLRFEEITHSQSCGALPCFINYSKSVTEASFDFSIYLFGPFDNSYSLECISDKKMGDYFSDIPDRFSYLKCNYGPNILDPDDSCLSKCEFLRAPAVDVSHSYEYTKHGSEYDCRYFPEPYQPNYTGPLFSDMITIAVSGLNLANGEYPKRFICPGDSRMNKWSVHPSSFNSGATWYNMTGGWYPPRSGGFTYQPFSYFPGVTAGSIYNEFCDSTATWNANPNLYSQTILPEYIL